MAIVSSSISNNLNGDSQPRGRRCDGWRSSVSIIVVFVFACVLAGDAVTDGDRQILCGAEYGGVPALAGDAVTDGDRQTTFDAAHLAEFTTRGRRCDGWRSSNPLGGEDVGGAFLVEDAVTDDDHQPRRRKAT